MMQQIGWTGKEIQEIYGPDNSNTKTMVKITNIAPQYKIDKDNQVEISHYLVDFTITKKNKGEVLRLSGQMSYNNEILNLTAIQGKILYELKNILES